jgi:hypothetical protein
MITHEIQLEGSDGSGRLLAANFATGRIVVQWGDWTSGYELRADGWHRFGVVQSWTVPATKAARDGGQPLGRCGDFDRVLIKPVGPGLAPLARWMLAQAGQLEPDQRTSLVVLCASPGPLTVAADWLLGLRRRLSHGADLVDLHARHRVGLAGPADIDDILRVLIALELVHPYDYDPQPGTRVGESAGQLDERAQREWRTQGKLTGRLGDDATRSGLPNIGLIFWLFRAGARLQELPEYSL